MRNTKLKGLIPFLPFVLAFFLALLLSWPSFSSATLTVSNTGLQGDTNITLDTNGSLGVGTASATAITIGQAALNVSIPGSLTVSSATTTVNNLHVTGSCLGCGLFSGITAINGLSNATTSLVAGSNITIATSSPNVITISASGGSGSTTPGGSNTQLQFNSSGAFGASANLTWLSPALTIGQSGTTTGQLKLAGGTSGAVTVQASSTAGTWTLTLRTSAGTSGYVLSTDGSGNTSWIAQSGGGSLNIDGLTNSTFNFTASGTGLSIATTSPNTVAYTWTNPGYVLSSTNNSWSGQQTFNATTTFNGAIVENTSGAGSVQLAEGTCPAAVSGYDILCANSSHALQLSLNGGSFLAVPQLSGDLGNTAAAPKVVGLQGIPVSSTTPTTNQVLAYNGSVWAPANAGSGITAINGLTNATTSILAGSGISIATSSPNIITITATGGGASSTWSGITNPTGNLSLNMGNFTTTFTVGATTTNPFLIQDTTGNTGTGPLLQVSTVGTSVALPVKFTAQGTSNGVQMNASGTLAVIGTGNINATQLQGIAVSTTTPTTNQVLTYNGTSWAPANASSTGGGSSVSVNGGSTISSPNFSSSTPSAPSGSSNITFQQSGNNVSAYVPTEGLYLSGTCSGAEAGAGTWGVIGLGLNPQSGACTSSWSANYFNIVTHICTLRNLYFVSGTAGASASDLAVTVWTAPSGGTLASTTVTCIAGTGKSCNDTTHTLSLSAGSMVSVQIVTVASSTGANFSVGMECD